TSLPKINLRKLIPTLAPYGALLFAILFLNWGLFRRLNPDEPFSTFEMPYEQPFEDVPVHRWFSDKGGQWVIQKTTLQQAKAEAENAQLFVPHWLAEDQPYHLSVEINLTAPGAAGLVFNAQYPDIYTQNQRAYVHRTETQYELIAGGTDAEGVFVVQQTVPLSELEQPFRLDVLVNEKTYTVQINGKTLIENRPLDYHNGLVGMIATNLATFDTLTLTAIEETAYNVDIAEVETLPTNLAPSVVGDIVYTSNFAGGSGMTGWVPISGDWEVVNGYLTQQDPTNYDFSIGYEPNTFQAYMLQVSLTHLDGIGGGILFNMPTPYQRNGAQMVRFSDNGNGLFWGYYDDAGEFFGQGHYQTPIATNTAYTLKILSGDTTYAVYLNDQPLASDIPLLRNSGYLGLITARSSVSFGLVEISSLLNELWTGDVTPTVIYAGNGTDSGGGTVNATPLPPTITPTPAPTDAATPTATPTPTGHAPLPGQLFAAASFFGGGFPANAAESAWNPLGGQWQINENFIQQTLPSGYDFGLVYTGQKFSQYQLDVTLSHLEGTGGGVLFNVPDPTALQWGSLVRYSQDNKLMWGYYDEAGKFKGQGSAVVPAPGDASHVLTIITKDTTYDLQLDGAPVAENVPLARKSGYIGLGSTLSAVRFESVKITLPERPTPTPPPLGEKLGNMQVVNGDWTQNGTVFTQNSTDFEDFILSTGVFAGVYTLETTITLPATPELQDAGGGVIFHMAVQGDRRNAHLVRLSGGGKGVFWGYFDDNGAFIGQGSTSFAAANPDGATPTPVAEGTPLVFQFKIIVQNDTYDLYVNGELIAAGIELFS
ncbi:MAG TPA: hypothetical protein PK530_18890, partial [Anaerolineales bacterium]|nr:hypothetical protein [Anaerolineales bacterium]